ncbi:MAG: PQQ-binding-like beta-propeller repeat protein [Chloroflexales bacterium]|nr:PQQ-binding-like beta-propeller repeat protein [Chloroflexales bacterium]
MGRHYAYPAKHCVLLALFLIGAYILAACGVPNETEPSAQNQATPPPATIAPTATPFPASPSPLPEPTLTPSEPAIASPSDGVATPTTEPAAIAATSPSVVHHPIVLTPENEAGWNQLGADPQRTGYVPDQLSDTWQLKWIWNGPDGNGDAGPAPDHLRLPKGVQPVVGDGRLYVGHRDGTVRAISEATGQQVWTATLGGEVRGTGAYDSTLNSVYAGSTNGAFYRLNASDGSIHAQSALGGRVIMSPLLVDDTIFIGSTNGRFYALDKSSLDVRWSQEIGSALWASPAYSQRRDLVIIQAEPSDPSNPDSPARVLALRASDGEQQWVREVNADVDPNRPPSYPRDPDREMTAFADTYPVVSDTNDVVIIRSYLIWDKWPQPGETAPATVAEIRAFLERNPALQSFFVLNLTDGQPRYIAPVMIGAIGNGGDFESPPPQVVLKPMEEGNEVAYVIWRSRQSCTPVNCSNRDDNTFGEMNLQTGDIRFIEDHKNAGSMRLHSDEESPISMAGDTILYAHWMMLGAIRITDRSPGLGTSYDNPIQTVELPPVLNTMAAGACSGRNSANRFCSQERQTPCDGFQVNPGFYLYYSDECIYDKYWTTPVRSAVVSNNTIYWKSVDGAIMAFQATP